jgi:hypothetical protein
MAVLGIDTDSNTIELSSNDRKQGTYIIGVNGSNFFWFTTFKEAGPDSILAEPIWVIPSKEGKMSLI